MPKHFVRSLTLVIIAFVLISQSFARPSSNEARRENECDDDKSEESEEHGEDFHGRPCSPPYKDFEDDDDDDELGGWAIAGILIGIAAFMAGLTAIACYFCSCCCCFCSRKPKQDSPGRVTSVRPANTKMDQPSQTPPNSLPPPPPYEEPAVKMGDHDQYYSSTGPSHPVDMYPPTYSEVEPVPNAPPTEHIYSNVNLNDEINPTKS